MTADGPARHPASSYGMRRPNVPVELTRGPFSYDQAAAAGLTHSALRSRPWRQVFTGVWAHEDVPDDRATRLAAAKFVIPSHGVLCGMTAAWIHGADVLRAGDLDVHAGFAKGRRIRSRPGLRVCQETLHPSDWTVIDDIAVTTPLRTAFDCLRWLRGAERLVVADALAHLDLVTVEELRRNFASQKRLRNLRRGEALIDDIEPKSESPMETRLRVEMITGG